MDNLKNNYKSEEEFLKNYDSSIFEKPSTTVDTVIFTVFDGCLHALVVKRSNYPFRDKWSLVGGYIDIQNDQNIEETAKRKLKEKTGVDTPYLEQFMTIGNKIRDPRGWSSTTVYFALIPCDKITLFAGVGSSDIKWLKIDNEVENYSLAFDHDAILQECILRLRNKVFYTSLPVYLMPEKFTLSELQKVFEIIMNRKIEHKSFRRRILKAGIIEEINEMQHGNKRPAQLYKTKDLSDPYFFTRNIGG